MRRMPSLNANNKIAAQLHAEAWPSDPFAYARMYTHLCLGLDDPQKVKEESLRKINIHTMAKKAREAANA